jgi:DNA-binding MarR family transcriptional regulator
MPDFRCSRVEASVSDARRAVRLNGPHTSSRGAERAANAARPRPQLGDLNGRLGYFVRRLQLWIFQDFIRAMASVGMSPAQYSVLVVVEENSGLSQSDIAECLGIERARLVRVLDRLEKRGFLKRRRSPTDRRSHALFLTRDGKRRMKHIRSLADAHESRVGETLGPANRRILLNVLRDFNG